MFKAKKEGYLHITLFFSLICGVHGYIFSGNSGCTMNPWAGFAVIESFITTERLSANHQHNYELETAS